MEQTTGLIDQALIDAAKAAHEAAEQRRDATGAALAEAKAKVSRARAASHSAAAGSGADSMEAELALESAERDERIAQKAADAAERAAQEAASAINRATAVAWRPVYVAALKQRFAAVQANERAHALLDEAARLFAEANTALQTAAAHGCGALGGSMAGAMPTVAHELAVFSDGARKQAWFAEAGLSIEEMMGAARG